MRVFLLWSLAVYKLSGQTELKLTQNLGKI